LYAYVQGTTAELKLKEKKGTKNNTTEK